MAGRVNRAGRTGQAASKGLWVSLRDECRLPSARSWSVVSRVNSVVSPCDCQCVCVCVCPRGGEWHVWESEHAASRLRGGAAPLDARAGSVRRCVSGASRGRVSARSAARASSGLGDGVVDGRPRPLGGACQGPVPALHRLLHQADVEGLALEHLARARHRRGNVAEEADRGLDDAFVRGVHVSCDPLHKLQDEGHLDKTALLRGALQPAVDLFGGHALEDARVGLEDPLPQLAVVVRHVVHRGRQLTRHLCC
mmetsp:Transcript_27625/g.65568  ORF Transcript_27625/g.65568 Transcript_27625/m.65568 type:complete len:253 (+) Transcript_27625:764-1522(+)